MTDTILYSREGHVGRLVLNNPERHNALGQEQLQGIRQHLTAVSVDEQVRVLILTGAGDKTFCAGASLEQLGTGVFSGDDFQAMTAPLAGLAIPTVCALNGNVFGAGVELALSCDFRIGIEGSRMRVPAAAIGICYPPSGIQRIIEGLGVNTARRVLLAAEEFDAQNMLAAGFLDYLVLPGRLADESSQFARRIAGLAPLAVRSMKEILQQSIIGAIDPARAQELLDLCSNSEDLREGLAAQQEKRAARFKGS